MVVQDVPDSGNPLPGTIHSIRNGKVTNAREYIDTLALAQGFEIAPAPLINTIEEERNHAS